MNKYEDKDDKPLAAVFIALIIALVFILIIIFAISLTGIHVN